MVTSQDLLEKCSANKLSYIMGREIFGKELGFQSLFGDVEGENKIGNCGIPLPGSSLNLKYEICFSAGVISISISSLMNLHDMLMTLLQRADVQLAAVEKIPTKRHRPLRTRKPKKDQDLKKDEKLEV